MTPPKNGPKDPTAERSWLTPDARRELRCWAEVGGDDTIVTGEMCQALTQLLDEVDELEKQLAVEVSVGARLVDENEDLKDERDALKAELEQLRAYRDAVEAALV